MYLRYTKRYQSSKIRLSLGKQTGGILSISCWKNIFQGLTFLGSEFFYTSHSSTIFITSPFLSSRILCNLSISSIVSILPLSLAAFRAFLCYSLSRYLFKWVELIRVSNFRFFSHSLFQIEHLVFLLFLILFCII